MYFLQVTQQLFTRMLYGNVNQKSQKLCTAVAGDLLLTIYVVNAYKISSKSRCLLLNL